MHHLCIKSRVNSILTYFPDVIIQTAMGEEAAIEAKEAPK